MLPSWVLRPGVSFGPFLLGDSVHNVQSLLSQFDFPYRQIFDFEHPFSQQIIIDMIVQRLIFDGRTQMLQAIHVFPFPQLIKIFDTTFLPAERGYPSAALQHPALSLKDEQLPEDLLKPNVGNIIGVLGASQTHLTEDSTCVFAFPQLGVVLVCPFLKSDKLSDEGVQSSVDVSPLIEPHFLVHTPVTSVLSDSHKEVLWFPQWEGSDVGATLYSSIAGLPLPEPAPSEHYLRPQYLIPGQGASFLPPVVSLISESEIYLSLPSTSITLHSQSNSVYPVLGYPSRILRNKPGDTLLNNVDPELSLDIWIYEQYGVCVVVNTKLNSVESIVCHTNLPGHPAFGMLQKCNFIVLPSHLNLPSMKRENLLLLENDVLFQNKDAVRDYTRLDSVLSTFFKEANTTSLQEIVILEKADLNCVLPTDNILHVSAFAHLRNIACVGQDGDSKLPVPTAFETPWTDFGESLEDNDIADKIHVLSDRIHSDIAELMDLTEKCVEFGEATLALRQWKTWPQSDTVKEIVVERQSSKDPSRYCVPWTYRWTQFAVECDASGSIAKFVLL